MNITAGLVLFVTIWFLALFVVLPLRMKTQGEAGEVVPGTHASAPENPQMWRKAKIATIAAIIVWAIVAGIILSGVISVRDLDVFGLGAGAIPAPSTSGTGG